MTILAESWAALVRAGVGGLVSNVAPSLVRKGIGALTVLDHDEVEASNLNRQRFYSQDIGLNKAIALVRNLQGESTCGTHPYWVCNVIGNSASRRH